MKYKIALPLIVASVLILGTIGIALGNVLTQRTVNLSVVEPAISVEPSGSQSVIIYRDTDSYIDYTVTNLSALPVHIEVTNSTLPDGVTVSYSQSIFNLATSASTSVRATFTASLDAPLGDIVITLNFDATPIS